jgi:hypothetical protein
LRVFWLSRQRFQVLWFGVRFLRQPELHNKTLTGAIGFCLLKVISIVPLRNGRTRVEFEIESNVNYPNEPTSLEAFKALNAQESVAGSSLRRGTVTAELVEDSLELCDYEERCDSDETSGKQRHRQLP